MPADTFNDRQPLQGMEFWVEITGQAAGTSRYAWSLTDDAAAGVFGTSSLAADFSTSGTSAVDGQPAYEVMGRTDVPVGEKVKARYSPDGEFLVFRFEAPTGAEPCGGSCGSLVGLADDACLKLSLVCAAGSFAAIDTDQFAAVYAFGSGGVWTFKVWDDVTEDWVDFELVPYPSGTPVTPVVFTWNGTPLPTLELGADTLTLRCLGEDSTFAAGPRNGVDGDPSYTPADECEPNELVLKVECDCCPLDGWEGDGWYCVAPADCETDEKSCVELLEEDGDHCAADADYVICSGPYASQSECEAACNPPVSVPSDCCDPEEAPIEVTLNMTAVLPAGSLGTATLTHDGVSLWEGTGSFTPGGCGTLDIQWELECDGSTWKIRHSCDAGANWSTQVTLTDNGASCNPISLGFVGYTLSGATGCGACSNVSISVSGSY